MKSLKQYMGVSEMIVEEQSPASLVEAMERVLGNAYAMYFKAHSYHWNVEGMFFPMFHDFFGKIYEEVYGSIDPTAEHIRILGQYAPVSLSAMMLKSSLKEDVSKPSSVKEMIGNLLTANSEVINSLNNAFALAEKSNDQGLMDFLAGRLEAHSKHNWMIKSTTKSFGEN